MLTLHLLGSPHITMHGEPLPPFTYRKALALLCYLLLTRRPHERSTLAGLFWSELPERDALSNLRQVLSDLRKRLPDHLLITRQRVAFDHSQPYWLDVDTFEQCSRALQEEPLTAEGAAALQRAAERYRGELLRGFSVRNAPLWEEWHLVERERLHTLATRVLQQLATFFSEHGDYSDAIAPLSRLLALEPWNEALHRQLMRLLVRSGQRHAAQQQYHRCRAFLAAEMGVPPMEETTRLYERIRAADALPRHNLPALTTRLVGRQPELELLHRRLNAPACRLLTVVGMGGTGKTRLALEAAADAAESFLHGVRFVPLAAASSPDQVPIQIAKSLQLPLRGTHNPVTHLLNFLRQREMLLVLDNFEHLLAASPLLSELLAHAPEVKLLVTSRERVNLHGEWLLELRGLPVPSQNTLEAVAASSAARLFVESAQRLSPTFALDQDRAPVVRQLCQLLEGMPLALELAATWTRALPLSAIVTELESGLGLLATEMRDLPPRHRSLRAVFEHSWQLLSPEERATFRKLAVFRGGFTREAGARVAGATLPLLSALVDKSLLYRVEEDRYGRHSLIWQFARDKLAARPDEWEQAHDAHCAYYLPFLEEQGKRLQGPQQKQALAALATEQENVRLAWQRMVERGEVDALDRALPGWAAYHALLGLFEAGEAALEDAITRVRDQMDAEAPTPERRALLAALLVERAYLLNEQASYEEAEPVAEAALAEAQAAGRWRKEVSARLQLSHALWRQSRYEQGQTHLQEALALLEAVPDGAPATRRLRAEGLLQLGVVSWYQGRYDSATRFLEQSLALAREREDLAKQGEILRSLGNVAWSRGELEQAGHYYEQSLATARQSGNRLGEGRALGNLGIVHLPRGAYPEAVACFRTSLEIFRELGNRLDESKALAHLGDAALYLGNFARAIERFEQCLHLNREIGDQQGEAGRLSTLAFLYHLVGDDVTALHYGHHALALAQAIHDPNIESDALLHIGHALAATEQLDEAATAYGRALALRQQLDERHRVAEARAGVARVALAQGRALEAREQVEQILSYLEESNLEGTEEPARIALICYHILRAQDDPRADPLLHRAHSQLQERAAQISDLQLRRTFLENVPAHRELLAVWAERSGARHPTGTPGPGSAPAGSPANPESSA